jgi:hypothetical protein
VNVETGEGVAIEMIVVEMPGIYITHVYYVSGI